MRIAQFTDTFLPVVDGVGRVVYNYAVTLCQKGHECYVIAPTADTGYRGGYPFELVDYFGSPVPGSPQYKAGFAIFDRHYHERMNMLQFDVVHAHTPFFAGSEALRISTKHGIPLVGTFHSKYYDDFYKATGAALLASLGTRAVVEFYERCDEVWAVSESSAAVLNEYGYHGSVKVVENGTELRQRRPEDAKAARERFALPGDKPTLLFVGQLNWKKNILRILEAAALLKRRGLDFCLVLAGQGPDRKAIEKKIEELDIQNLVIFTGHITDNALLDGLYQCASLFVFPSVYDNAPMVLREAAVMGTPAVLVRGSCAAEVVTDNQNGLLVGDSAEEMVELLSHAMGDAALLERLGEAAAASIPVGWDNILDTALARYGRLIRLNAEGQLTEKSKKLLT